MRLDRLFKCLLPVLLFLSFILLSSVSYLTSFSFSLDTLGQSDGTEATSANDEFCPPPSEMAKRGTKQPNQEVCISEDRVKKRPAECHGGMKFEFECQWTRYWQLYTNKQLLSKYEQIEALVQPMRVIVHENVKISYNELTSYSELTFKKIVKGEARTKPNKPKNFALLKALDNLAKKNNHLILDLHTSNVVMTESGEVRIIDMNVLPSRWFRWNVEWGLGTFDTKLKGMDNLYGHNQVFELYS